MKSKSALVELGGPGSGRKPEGGYSEQPSSSNPGKPRAGVALRDLFPERAPPQIEYTERPSSSNPGKPRAGVSIRDLFPERQGQTREQLISNLRKPSKR